MKMQMVTGIIKILYNIYLAFKLPFIQLNVILTGTNVMKTKT